VAPAGPISADEVARKTFPASFRGFDPDQVRVFLGQVAAELAALQERERLLVERVAAAEGIAAEAERTAEAAVAASVPPEPGEAELMAALGREAGRVLAAAKEAGAEIRSTAEAHASRVHRDARDEAARLRGEAEQVAEDRAAEAEALATSLRSDAEEAAAEIRAEAERQAAVTIEAAADRGREMVREAQAVRERILRDLARRRRTAHQQLEQLRVGRERLLETYGVIRSIMDEATAEVAVAEVEARAAAEAAVVQLEEPEPSIEELEAEVVAMRETPEPGDEEAEAPDEAAAEGPVEAATDVEDGAVDDDPAEEPPAPEPAAEVIDLRDPSPEPLATVAERRTSALRILRPAEPETAPPPAAETEDPGEAPSPVEHVFARLRADRAAADGAEPEDDESASRALRRDAVLAPLERELARALKRELADEQNAVLDALRRSRGRPTLDDLLPDAEAGVARYASVASGHLAAAAAAGAAAVGDEGVEDGEPPAVDDIAHDLAVEVADALRADVAAALEVTGGDHAGTAERISTAYRDWKSSRAEPLARSAALAAEARGRLAAGTPLCWLPDPEATPCPDCTANAAAGARTPGEVFPSGVPHPPAHPDCRCLVAPLDR